MPDVQIFDCEQGTDEWLRCRVGIPTASMFATLLRAGDSKTRTKYLHMIVGEVMSKRPAETFQSFAMRRGKEMEAVVREQYRFEVAGDLPVTQIGFAYRPMDNVGGSPDALVGDDGVVEIKTMAPEAGLIDLLLRDTAVPKEHVAQCQGNLWVLGRKWCDLVIGFQGLPLKRWRIGRDDGYIKMLADEVALFNYEVRKLVKALS